MELVMVIIPILGFGIIIFCILSFFFPYGDKFKGKIQKIKGFGVDLQISIFTLFIIIGATLVLTGIYLYMEDYEKQLSEAENKVETAINKEKEAIIKEREARNELASAGKIDLRIVVKLEGIEENDMPDIKKVKFEYFVPGSDQPIAADVLPGPEIKSFKIILNDVSSATYITKLVLHEENTGRKWGKVNFMPLEPVFLLVME